MGPYNLSTFGLVSHGNPQHFAPFPPLSLWPTLHKSQSFSSHVSFPPPLLPPHFDLPFPPSPEYHSTEKQNHYWFPGFVLQLLNTYLQARWVSHYKSDYDGKGGLFWWKFFGGLVLFLWGMRINLWADKVLLGLKRESGGYKVPRGGWFELGLCQSQVGIWRSLERIVPRTEKQ
ncbi:unnamed protein product [Dovyalis caffra]|uniref:3-oxo-5-alpha-steroid 4-dehydrogenase C-terminal domain-containing protein n=1 Tax=Dovyalis caffra TaxID=77055 RepID=A0AAV1SEF5_9ROSI|nr:unnamed protein product [Dovyalis caffra]